MGEKFEIQKIDGDDYLIINLDKWIKYYEANPDEIVGQSCHGGNCPVYHYLKPELNMLSVLGSEVSWIERIDGENTRLRSANNTRTVRDFIVKVDMLQEFDCPVVYVTGTVALALLREAIAENQ